MQDLTLRPAVFLDRDRTLIEDPGYISHPDQVRLLGGAAEAVSGLREAGFAVVVVTNQSGVARGLISEDGLKAIHLRMRDLLRAEGADLDGVYYCPYLDGPEAVREQYRLASDLRKPRPGMLLLAADELGLDLGSSWAVGDSLRDVQAGRAAGCRTILIGGEPVDDEGEADCVAADLREAAERILQVVRPSAMQQPAKDNAARSEEPSAEIEAAEAMAGGDLPRPPAMKGKSDASAYPPSAAAMASGSSSSPASEGRPSALPRSSAPPPGAADGRSMAVVEDVLSRIHEELHMLRRERQYEDFSIAKLVGAVAEAFALCAIGWGLYSWMTTAPGPDPEGATAATIWLLAGIGFQLVALTCLVTSIRK